MRGFLPAFIGRGVMQISSYIDSDLASLLPLGSVAVFGYAQTLYTLPVSLFGMAVSAAELPAMSAATGSEAEIAEWLRRRLEGSLSRIAFFVIPSAAAFLAIGDVIAAGLFESGKFESGDATRVWMTLAGSSVGMLAQTWGRLYSSTWYALKDTRTPLRFAIVRVILTTVLGYLMAIRLPGLVGIDASYGLAGLTASAGIAGWVEYLLLKRALDAKIGATGLSAWKVGRLWIAAGGGAVAAWAVKLGTAKLEPHPILAAIAICSAFGLTYGLGTALLGVEEARMILRRMRIVKGS